jgi:DNA-binding NarL/FixJ family response regulator
MDEPIRVLVVDDHTVVRRGICDYLADEPDIEVVATAADGTEALAKVDRFRPDVVVLDIQMPGLSGIQVTERIKAQHPAIKMLILTAYDNDPYIFSLLQKGVSGYLLKTAGPDDLIRAVHAVHRGQSVLGPEIAQRVTRRMALDPAHGASETEPLTEREIEVLKLAGRGLTNQAIAEMLILSDRTVQGHLAHVYAKLQVANRTEAVLQALRLGWFDVSDLADG